MSMLTGNMDQVRILQEQDESLRAVRTLAMSRDSRFTINDGVFFTALN
jgi:hypothetical protein